MAGLFERFRGGLKLRVKPNENAGLNNIVSPTQDITAKQLESENIGSAPLLDLDNLQNFRSVSSNRHNKFIGFEEMLEDPIIAAALQMYVDDSCQYNDKGEIIWAEGENKQAVDAANRLIEVLDINKRCWRDIYSLCAYGDLYLRLYKEGDESDYTTMYSNDNRGLDLSIMIKPEDTQKKYEEYIEAVDDPAAIFDLQTKGKTAGFIRVCDTSDIQVNSILKSQPLQTVSNGNVISYDRMSFIHIALAESVNRKPELLKIEDEEGKTSEIYKIKSGKSILEDAYPVTQTLKLLEDSLVLNRMTRSAILRLIQIEVGDMPKQDVTNLLHRYRNLFEQKMSMNVQAGQAKAFNSPGPMDNMVYTPTKNGLGAINVQNIGGDVNVKDIADLDYFNNKKLAALKIPKQFLNFDSPEGIGGNGVSLTKISSRYAHTIIRIQNAYVQGITDLINYFFIDKGLDYVNKFTVRMVTPSTIEDNERSEKLNNDISQTRDILDLLTDLSEKERLECLKILMSDKLRITDIAAIIEEHLKNTPDEDEFGDDEFGEDDFGGNAHGRSGGGSHNDFDIDIGGPDIDMGEPEPMEMGGEEPGGEELGGEEPTMTPEQ